MIQYHFDFPIPMWGYFTLEKDLLNCSLVEMEQRLGYSAGRIKQGADIFILESPSNTSDFDYMGTTMFPAHRLESTGLGNSLNSDKAKHVYLRWFREHRLIKVVPLTTHLEAMKSLIDPKDYAILKDIELFAKGKSDGEVKQELLRRFDHATETKALIMSHFKKKDAIKKREDINDELYPPALGACVPQWKLNMPVNGRCLFRMTDYHADRLEKI
jgi:hypothetical protein